MLRLNLLFLLLFTGCSFKSIVIPNATYFIADRIGGKYDFYYSQEKEFKKGLDQLLKEKHKGFAELNVHLKQVEITNYNIEEHLPKYFKIYQPLVLGINKLLAKPFSEFNPDQVENVYEVFEDDNETILNRSRKDKTEEFKKRFEFFFGELNKSQTELIRTNINVFQQINKKRLENRLITQSAMKKVFLSKRSKEEKHKEFINIFNENLTQREPLQNMQKVGGFLKVFFKTLTKDQIKYFKKKQKLITEWIDAGVEHFKNLKTNPIIK